MFRQFVSALSARVALRTGSAWLHGLALLLILWCSCGLAGASAGSGAGLERTGCPSEIGLWELASDASEQGAADRHDCRKSASLEHLVSDLVHGEAGDQETQSVVMSIWQPMPHCVPLSGVTPDLPHGVYEPLLRPPARRA